MRWSRLRDSFVVAPARPRPVKQCFSNFFRRVCETFATIGHFVLRILRKYDLHFCNCFSINNQVRLRKTSLSSNLKGAREDLIGLRNNVNVYARVCKVVARYFYTRTKLDFASRILRESFQTPSRFRKEEVNAKIQTPRILFKAKLHTVSASFCSFSEHTPRLIHA